MKTNRYYLVLTIGIISLGLLLTGGTYAWLNFGATIGDNTFKGNSICFNVDYSGKFPMLRGDVDLDGVLSNNDVYLMRQYIGTGTGLSNIQINLADVYQDGKLNTKDVTMVNQHVNGIISLSYDVLFPSKTDKGGIVGYVAMNINESCNVSAVGDIKLNIGSATDSKYFMNGALKYSLYASDHTTLISSGILNDYGNTTLNTSPITLTETPTMYFVYIWLDGTKVDNSYLNLSFDAYLSASATQTES